MITTITLNPAIDKTILVNDLELGGVNRIAGAREDIGGKGVNVTKLLHRLNARTQACGFLGRKNRKQVELLLSGESFEHHFIEIDGITRTNTKIVELDRGATTDLNEQGFYVEAGLYEQFKEFIIKLAQESDYMVFSGSLPQGLTDKAYKELIELVGTKTLTVLDADGQKLVEGMSASPYMIKPNILELETAFDVEWKTDEEIIRFCRSIQKKYDIKLILVSMGGAGSLLVTEQESYKAEPIKVEVKSTVGAGDSMLAGMLYGIDSGLPLDKAFAYATACGTLAVTKEGTQSFSTDEVHEMLKRVQISIM